MKSIFKKLSLLIASIMLFLAFSLVLGVSAKSSNTNLGDHFYAYIINREAGNYVTNDSTNVSSRKKTELSNQQWEFTKYKDNGYKIMSMLDGKCLDVSGGSSKSKSNVQVYADNGTIAQRWYVSDNGNGTYTLKAGCTNCVLDLVNKSKADGANIWVYTNNYSSAQNFKIVKFDLLPQPVHLETAPPTASRPGAYPIKHVIQQWSSGNNPDYNPDVWGKYDSISKTACGVAAASMALSSLGIDKSPIEICDLNVAAGNGGDYMSCWEQLAPRHYRYVTLNSTEDIDNALSLYLANPAKYSPPIMYLYPRHFVVVTGQTDTNYWIYDPGFPEDNRPLSKPAAYSEVHQFSR